MHKDNVDECRNTYNIDQSQKYEVKTEVEAQIQTAISLGIQPTHLDSHAA